MTDMLEKHKRIVCNSLTSTILPPRVEGVSFPSSTVQVQDRDKKPMQDEGPSGGLDIDFILIDDDVSSLTSKLRETIQE